jgi:phosphoglycolate phosphatase
MHFKGILFDKDGTLFDVDGTWVPFYREMLQLEMNVSLAEAERLMALAGYDGTTDRVISGSVMAGGTTQQLVHLWWPDRSVQERASIAKRVDTEYADLALRHLKELLPLDPPLKALKNAGYQMGVATNDSYPSASRHVAAKNLGHYFSAILTADRVPLPKPSGDMIRAFASQTGLAPGQIVMVGDNHHDIQEARNGGAGLAIGVLTGNGKRDELLATADHVIDSVADLPGLLVAINATLAG